MQLHLQPIGPGARSGPYWQPFEEHAGFNEQWWSRRRPVTDRASVFSVRQEEAEVARVEMVAAVLLGEYRPIPTVYGPCREIGLIEVRHDLLGAKYKYGTRTVRLLNDLYAGEMLLARTRIADGFWKKLGWSQHIHCSDDEANPRRDRLYVQPRVR